MVTHRQEALPRQQAHISLGADQGPPARAVPNPRDAGTDIPVAGSARLGAHLASYSHRAQGADSAVAVGAYLGRLIMMPHKSARLHPQAVTAESSGWGCAAQP